MNECVEDGRQGLAGEFETGTIVVQTPHSLLCEMFCHLAGLALQMVLRFLTHLLVKPLGDRDLFLSSCQRRVDGCVRWP